MMHPFLLPLSILAALAAWSAGHGMAAVWNAETGAWPLPPAPYVVAAAVQMAFVAALIIRRASVALPAWLALFTFCHEAWGFVGHAWTVSVLLQGLVWLLARGLRPPEPWGDRLARWRGARAAIELQIACAGELCADMLASAGRLMRGEGSAAPMAAGPPSPVPAADLEPALTTALDAWIAEIDTTGSDSSGREAGHAA